MRTLLRLVVVILSIVGASALSVGLMLWAGGISAQRAPGRLEASLAPRLRSMMIPSAAKHTTNPVPASLEAVKAGMEHFADHCAICVR